ITLPRLGSGVRVSFPAPEYEKPLSKDKGFFIVFEKNLLIKCISQITYSSSFTLTIFLGYS
ncbi:hypothetical protein, partial [Acinetobacter sp.]|uniref:hypothetical protein n=1 Tax=Acinetobacter sp. TaxID=472 RepID=UPI0028AE7B93